MAKEVALERVSKAIIERASLEAEAILEKARKDAEKIINKAKMKRKTMYEREAAKIIEAAKRKARAILVQAILKTRRKIAETKHEIVNNIVNEAKEALKKRSFNIEKSLKNLLLEAMFNMPSGKVVIYINPKDRKVIEKIISEEGLRNRVEKIFETNNISGGVIVESIDGKFKIDNSYDTRLDMVVSRILPRISKELFGE